MWTFLKSLFRFDSRKAKVLESWGKQKFSIRPLDYPKLLFDLQPPDNAIDEQTSDDLDLDGLFRFTDRTVSGPGAQILYQMLRDAGDNQSSRTRLEQNIEHLATVDRETLILYLHDLSGNKDYLFPYMLYGELPSPSRYLQWIKLLQLSSFALLLFGLLYPVLYIVFVPILAVNLFIHYRHKQDVGHFVDIFSRMKQLHQTGGRILELMTHLPAAERDQLEADIGNIQKMLTRSSLLMIERARDSEFGEVLWGIAETVKFATLIDVTMFSALLKRIKHYQAALERIYRLVGETDAALSVIALRESLPVHCRPKFQEDTVLTVQGLYHPLLPGAVANDLDLTSGSLLVTGSNMSGKSTFIKTLNLNAVAAQALNTAFATTYTSRIWRFATSINLRDDLSEGSSYYLAEVQRIGELMEYAAQSGRPYMLTIDEVFKGTNTIERIAAAKAVLSYLAQQEALTLVSTHDLELADLLAGEYELYHFQESVTGQDLSFDYRIKPGVMTERNAVKLLRIAGYPEEVVKEARRIAEAL